MEDGQIININHVYSLNFRISRQIIGSGNKILKYILNIEKNTIYNTLIVSSPGARKNYYYKRYRKATCNRYKGNKIFSYKCWRC
jgi:stage III sporulation protein AA